jgi:hypothetical protein
MMVELLMTKRDMGNQDDHDVEDMSGYDKSEGQLA